MPKAVPLLCAFFLSPFLAAQDKVTTSPPGYETIEGTKNSVFFGYHWTDARYQCIDVEFVGAGVKSIKQVGYRYDWSARSDSRNWQKVTLHVSQRNSSPLSLTFSANSAGTPTKVFDASVTWPSKLPNPIGTGPARWDRALAFPFSSTWTYDGKSGLILDYLFTGVGVWSSVCNLDATDMSDFTAGTGLYLGRNLCTDSAWTTPASFDLRTKIYARDYIAPTSLSNTARVDVAFSLFTAPNAPVVYAISTRGSVSGVPFLNVACNRLHIDLSIPPIFLLLKADAGGFAFIQNLPAVPYSPASGGRYLYGQAAWDDSKTLQLKLTTAYQASIPQPLARKRCVVLGISPFLTTATGIARESDNNPIPLYTYQ